MQVNHAGSWRGGPGRVGGMRRCAGLAPAFEGLDDEHASATAWARRAGIVGFDRRDIGHGRDNTEQLAGVFEVSLAGGASEQAVMTDAMEALRENVDQEAADELVSGQRHQLLPVGDIVAVILVA